MRKIALGSTDIEAAPVIFGGNVFGWTLNEKESFKILDKAVEAGLNTIDTADSYSHWAAGNRGGESEAIIGKWMKSRGNRDEINVITKVGTVPGREEKDISEAHILEAADHSLKRLQTEQIDLYLTHWDNKAVPVEETLGAYEKLIKAGKVRNIGASNLSPKRLRESLNASAEDGLPRYEVFQPGYNLYDRQDYEQGAAEICRQENLGVITYYSLASGFLSGKYRSEDDLDKSKRGGGVKKYLDERGKRILSVLDKIAATHDVSSAGVALAWLIHNPNVSAPIASATKLHHIQAFVEAMQLELSPEEMQHLDQASEY